MAEIDQLVSDLQSNELPRQRAAAEELAKHPESASRAVIALLETAAHRDEILREWVFEAIENMGPAEPHDLPALVNHLEHFKSSDQQFLSLKVLGRSGHDASDFLDESLQYTNGNYSNNVRVQAIKTSVKIASDQQRSKLKNRLEELANDSDKRVRFTAARMQKSSH